MKYSQLYGLQSEDRAILLVQGNKALAANSFTVALVC